MANELPPLPKGASYDAPTESLPPLPKGASYDAPTGDLPPLPKGASYEAPTPPAVNNPRQFPKSSMTPTVADLIAAKNNQEVPTIDNPALQNMGIKTDDAATIANLAGASTGNSKADIARYTLAKQNLDAAKLKAQQAFRSGATQDQANEIYSNALGPIATVTPSAASWEKPEDTKFATGATGLADTWQAAKATGVALKRGAAKGEAGLSQAAGGQLRFAQDMVGMDTGNTVSTLDAIDKRVSEIGDSSSHPVQLFEGAISSITQQIPAMAGSILTGTEGFALANIFANSFGQTYDDSRRKGLDVADSTIRSGAYASLEVLGEKFGLGDTLKGIKAAAKGVPANDLTSHFAKALVKEIPGEQLTYAGQFAVDKGYGLNPEAGIKAFLDGAVDTLGATVIQGSLMLGGGHLANKAMNSMATKMPDLFARTIDAQQTQQAEQVAEAAKQSALGKWKALGATNKPAQEQVQVQPAQEQVIPPHEELVKQYIAQGQTKDNAVLLADQDIADQKEAENARGTITPTAGTSPEVSGQPTGTSVTEGTEPRLGPTMAGVGNTASTIENGTVPQQNPLVQAMHNSGQEFKNPSQVKKFVAQVAPEQVASITANDPKAFKALLEEWKTTKPEAVQETPPLPKGATLTQPEEVTQQAAPVTEEVLQEEPHVAEGKKLAAQLAQLDPYNHFVEVLKDPMVTPAEVEEGKSLLAEYTGKQAAPEKTPASEESATIDDINSTLGQLHSPEQLQANPPTVVNAYADLPEGVRQQAEEGGTTAFVDPATGKDYYIASQIPKNQIKGKILHERGAHIGLTRLIGGPRLEKLANQVLEWAKGDGTLENTIAKEAAHWADQSGEEPGSERHSQEVVAYFTEIAVDDYGIDPLKDQPESKKKVLAWLRDLWQGVIEAIQKLNIDPSTLTAQDIVKMVQGAARLGTSPRETAEAKGVFTPKMAEDLRIVMGESKLVSEELAAEPEEEPVSPKIQASARDLNNKLGYTSVGINKMFTEMFYDEIKQYGNDENAIDLFISKKIDNPELPKPVEVTARRLLSQLPEKTLENAVGANSSIIQAWEDPEGTAKKQSEQLSRDRISKVQRVRNAVDTAILAIAFDDPRKYPNNTFYKAKVLINTAITKFSIAGNRAVAMTSENEYLPISENIGSDFVDAMTYGLEQGKPLKTAFEEAYVSTALADRTPLIETRVGPTLTGWTKFSDTSEAPDLQVITSDTGSTKGNWCIGREASYGESYLSSSDMFVYLQNGESLVSALVDKQTQQPTEWFGIGDGQKVLPQHLKIKSTLPTLDPNLPISTKEVEKANAYKEAKKILKDVAIGDEDALRKTLAAIATYSYPDSTEGILRKSLGYDFNSAITDITGVTESTKDKIKAVSETLDRKQDFVTVKDIYPKIAKYADANGEISIPVRGVDISDIPDDVFASIDQLIEDKNLNLKSAKEVFRVASAGSEISVEIPSSSLIYQSLKNSLSEAEDNDGNYAGLLFDVVSDALEPLRSWWLAQPNVPSKLTLDINRNISDDGYVSLSITPINKEGNKHLDSGYEKEWVSHAVEKIYTAHDIHDWGLPDSPNYVNSFYKAIKVYALNSMGTLLNELSTEIKNESPRILASKKGKVDKILLKIERSESAESIGSALDELMEAGTWDDKKQVLKASWDTITSKGINNIIPALTTSQITDWVGDRIPHLLQVTKNVEKMSVMRSKMLGAIADIVSPWVDYSKSNMSSAKNLSRMMHYSTLGEVDPSLYPNIADALKNDSILNATRKKMDAASGAREKAAYKGQITTRTRHLVQAYKMWSTTDAQGKEIYKKVRDHYKTTFNLHRAILDDRVAKSAVPGDINDASTPKGKLMAAIRSTYEDAKSIGVYFPLMRYGDYWASYGKGANKEFHMFESETQRNLFLDKRIAQLQKEGDTRSYDDIMESGEFDAGNNVSKLRDASTEASEMLKGIFTIIDTTGVQDKEALKDAVYQMYLMTMPEQSFRKQFIHRKGTAGFSGDALRNFVRSGYTAAGQLSRHKFGPDISLEMDSAHKALEGMPPKDKVKLGIFLDEITKRVGEELAPVVEDQTLARIANGANQAAFLWRLTSPKSAIANMTAIPVFGLPVLASRYGEVNAAATLARYGNVYNHTTFVTPDGKYTPLSVGMSKFVQSNKVYAAAFEEAAERGITEITRTYDLLAMARSPSTAHQSATSRGIRAGINMAGMLFHHSERLNREIMFMASFELAYKKATKEGLSGGIKGDAFNRAIDEAVKNTYDSMFNYTKYNRPSIMRSPSARVIFQFKLFPQQVTAYLVRNFWTMVKGSKLNPRARREATTQLIGTLLMGGLFSGIVGLPLYSLILGTIQGLRKLFEGKDDPIPIEERDLDLWFRKYLDTHFGAAAKYMEKGPISAATNLDIGSSTSFNNLWFRDSKYDASMANEFTDFVVGAAGPSVGLGIDTLRAYDDFRTGHFNEGVEKLLPALVKGAYTQYVWGKEGIKVKGSQADIINKEEVTKAERFWKAFGFNPTELTRIQEANYPVQELIQRAQDERSEIMARLNLELSRENDVGFEKALQDAVQFSIANPEMAILGNTIATSAVNKAKLRAMADHGLIVPPKLMPRLYDMVKYSRPKESADETQQKFDAKMKAAEEPVVVEEDEEE